MSTKTEVVDCGASYCEVFSDHFLVSEFFNSHACFRQLWKAPEISSSGPGYACSLLEGSAPPPRKMLT